MLEVPKLGLSEQEATQNKLPADNLYVESTTWCKQFGMYHENEMMVAYGIVGCLPAFAQIKCILMTVKLCCFLFQLVNVATMNIVEHLKFF